MGSKEKEVAMAPIVGGMVCVLLFITMILVFFVPVLGNSTQGAKTVEKYKSSYAEYVYEGYQSVKLEEPNYDVQFGGDTATTTTEEAFEGEEGDYIFPNSDTEQLTVEQISSLTDDELRLARNEIYARHGRMFKDESMQAYFDSKSWYEGLYSPEEFDKEGDSVLNEIEIYNRDLIQTEEKNR